MSVTLTIIGLALLVIGVGLWSIPGALVLLGIVFTAAGLIIDFEEE